MTMQNEQKQSFVETKMPPGYVLEYMGHEFFGWRSATANSQIWESSANTRRSAWRHWTKSILRGHNIRWYSKWMQNTKDVVMNSSIYCSDVWLSAEFNGFSLSVGGYNDDGESVVAYIGSTQDIDEAMARFASALFASCGM